MTRNVVNLDALLPREDLSAPVEGGGNIKGLKAADLKDGSLTYSWLRKPDFQRETANWSPMQVADLIETFANGDIIPAIILWQNGQRVFVVDGAHRLSALIAWVQDDYGAGDISGRHYQNAIPDYQRAMHNETRHMVHKRVGTFGEHELAPMYPAKSDPALLKRSSIIAFKGIDVQWIENADVKQARRAFFRINQGGTEIDATEKRILNAQNSAVAIASRAVARGGTGHSYWKKFAAPMREEIESLGAEIQRLLFMPPLNFPIKTLDVPLAGFGYGAHVLPFAFDLVSIANDLTIPDSIKTTKTDDKLSDDPDGTETVSHLTKTKKCVQLLLSNEELSLGLHPALYVYTTSGTFQPAALLNVLSWLMDLEQRKKVTAFLKVRRTFEKLFLDHPVLAKPASHKLGSGARTRRRMVLLYERVFDLLSTNDADVWGSIISEPGFEFLASDDYQQKQESLKGGIGQKFSRKAKSAGFFEQALPTANRCALCGGLLYMNGIVSDHEDERSEGGSSTSANARPVHPRCNSERAALS